MAELKRCLVITPLQLKALRKYAQADAAATGGVMPSVDGSSIEGEAVALARFMADSGQYMAGDWNLDNRKRNVAIRTFLEISLADLRRHGREWLDRWRDQNGKEPWFQEWVQLIDSASDAELTHVLLSSAQEPTRQRTSMPSGLLDAATVLWVKRSGMPI